MIIFDWNNMVEFWKCREKCWYQNKFLSYVFNGLNVSLEQDGVLLLFYDLNAFANFFFFLLSNWAIYWISECIVEIFKDNGFKQSNIQRWSRALWFFRESYMVYWFHNLTWKCILEKKKPALQASDFWHDYWIIILYQSTSFIQFFYCIHGKKNLSEMASNVNWDHLNITSAWFLSFWPPPPLC